MKITFSNGQVLKVSEKHNIAFFDNLMGFKFRFASDLNLE
jgi:hypothetical protein